jgi:hypothetical protein
VCVWCVIALCDDLAHSVLQRAALSIQQLRAVWVREDRRVLDALDAIGREMFSPHVKALGWTAKPDEDPFDTQLRALSIATAGQCGDEA